MRLLCFSKWAFKVFMCLLCFSKWAFKVFMCLLCFSKWAFKVFMCLLCFSKWAFKVFMCLLCFSKWAYIKCKIYIQSLFMPLQKKFRLCAYKNTPIHYLQCMRVFRCIKDTMILRLYFSLHLSFHAIRGLFVLQRRTTILLKALHR